MNNMIIDNLIQWLKANPEEGAQFFSNICDSGEFELSQRCIGCAYSKLERHSIKCDLVKIKESLEEEFEQMENRNTMSQNS